MATCPQCGTYFVESNGYFGCCSKNCYAAHTDGRPWNRDMAEAGIDLAFKGIEAGANFLFGNKSKSSAGKSGSSSSGYVMTEAERERQREEIKEFKEEQRKEWEGKEITVLKDWLKAYRYKEEPPFTLDAYHEEIDFIFDLGVKAIIREFTLHNKSKPGAEMKKETEKNKILNELEKYREKYKEKLKLYFDRLNSGKKIKNPKIKNTLLDFYMKAFNLAHKAFKKAFR